jgi:hypothetical protein
MQEAGNPGAYFQSRCDCHELERTSRPSPLPRRRSLWLTRSHRPRQCTKLSPRPDTAIGALPGELDGADAAVAEPAPDGDSVRCVVARFLAVAGERIA